MYPFTSLAQARRVWGLRTLLFWEGRPGGWPFLLHYYFIVDHYLFWCEEPNKTTYVEQKLLLVAMVVVCYMIHNT